MTSQPDLQLRAWRARQECSDLLDYYEKTLEIIDSEPNVKEAIPDDSVKDDLAVAAAISTFHATRREMGIPRKSLGTEVADEFATNAIKVYLTDWLNAFKHFNKKRGDQDAGVRDAINIADAISAEICRSYPIQLAEQPAGDNNAPPQPTAVHR